MKTYEELNALEEDIEAVSKKVAELNEDELAQVSGGNSLDAGNDGIPCDAREGKAVIAVPKGVTLDVEGSKGTGTAGGGAGILVP